MLFLKPLARSLRRRTEEADSQLICGLLVGRRGAVDAVLHAPAVRNDAVRPDAAIQVSEKACQDLINAAERDGDTLLGYFYSKKAEDVAHNLDTLPLPPVHYVLKIVQISGSYVRWEFERVDTVTGQRASEPLLQRSEADIEKQLGTGQPPAENGSASTPHNQGHDRPRASEQHSGQGTPPQTHGNEPANQPHTSGEVSNVAPLPVHPSSEREEAHGHVRYLNDYYGTIETETGQQVNFLLANHPHLQAAFEADLLVRILYEPSTLTVVESVVLDDDEDEQGPPSADWFRRQTQHRESVMEFLAQLRESEHLLWYGLKLGREAVYAEPQRPLAPNVHASLSAALDVRSFQFYRHQAATLDALRSKNHVMLLTATASGKTLCYNPAVVDAIAEDPQAHALYIFPLNALMLDQEQKLKDLQAALEARGVTMSIAHLKGGMGSAERDALAETCPNIVATNPEMVNQLLKDQHKGAWPTFFQHLRYIVVDEVHMYRSMFGMHMANILRRLSITLVRSGARPQYILSSATVGDPQDLAERLTKVPRKYWTFVPPDEDGSAQRDKHWAVVTPPPAATDANRSRSHYAVYTEYVAELFVRLLMTDRHEPLHTIVFARSIKEVKQIFDRARTILQARRPELSRRITQYVAADLKGDDTARRDIYEGLKEGRYVGVISTTALEAGIDIGALDACIIAGFPDSVMTMRQMAGRCGRRQEGLVVFVPHPRGALDSYYAEHPQQLLKQSPEVYAIDPSTPSILRRHIYAAAFEQQGIWLGELQRAFGATAVKKVLAESIAAGALTQTDDWVRALKGDLWRTDQADPHFMGDLRSNRQMPFVLCRNPRCGEWSCDTRCTARVAEVEQLYAYRDAHPGAVYQDKQSELYRCVSLDEAKRRIVVKKLPDDTRERTFGDMETSIEVVEVERTKRIVDGVDLYFGKVRVQTIFSGFYRYFLIPRLRCRSCKRTYPPRRCASCNREAEHFETTCPVCYEETMEPTHCPAGHPLEVSLDETKPERQSFPAPFDHDLYLITLDTVGIWLSIDPALAPALEMASPCKIVEDNKVMEFVRRPTNPTRLIRDYRLSAEEAEVVYAYHQRAQQALNRPVRKKRKAKNRVFPAVYGHCLREHLLRHLEPDRAGTIFATITGYQIDNNHVCRDCRSNMLYPALHTLEHQLLTLYPSTVMGDRDDVGGVTFFLHEATRRPTLFIYDNYDQGIGASEKIYDHFDQLLEHAVGLRKCTCGRDRGCPLCVQRSRCTARNDHLSKNAAQALLYRLLSRGEYEVDDDLEVDAHTRRSREDKPAPRQAQQPRANTIGDPCVLLRVLPQVHDHVLGAALHARAEEIDHDMPPLSLEQLQEAFNLVHARPRPEKLHLEEHPNPYHMMHLHDRASLRVVEKVRRVLTLKLHPDRYPKAERAAATAQMQLLNTAFDRIRKLKQDSGNGESAS